MTSGRRIVAVGGAVLSLSASACAGPVPAGAGRPQTPSRLAAQTSPGAAPASVAAGQTRPSALPAAVTASSPPAPLDSDGDGIPDDRDRCPHEPENYNGCNDDDGCPDKIVVRPLQRPRWIRDRFYFDPGRSELAPKWSSLLDAVALTINGSPELGLVEVEGYSDSDERRGDRVAAARAKEVIARLVDRGVPRERLVMRAYGARRPICTNDNEDCYMQNRRVLFNIPHPPPPLPPPILSPGDCWSRLL